MINIGVIGHNKDNPELIESLRNSTFNKLILFGAPSDPFLKEYEPVTDISDDFQQFLQHSDLVLFSDYDVSKNEFIQEIIRKGKHVHIINAEELSPVDIIQLNKMSKEANVKVSIDFLQLYLPIVEYISENKPILHSIHIKDANHHTSIKRRILNAIRTLNYLVRKEIKSFNTYNFQISGASHDYIQIRIEFSNGSIACLEIHPYFHEPCERYELITEKEIITFDVNCEMDKIHMKEVSSNSSNIHILPLDYKSAYNKQWLSLIHHIQQNTQPENCVSELYHTYETFNRITKKLDQIQ